MKTIPNDMQNPEEMLAHLLKTTAETVEKIEIINVQLVHLGDISRK